MKKLLALVVIALLIAPVVISQPLARRGIPKIKTVVALGRGIAVSKQDATDFEIVKIGVAGLIVKEGNETEELSLGVLWLGDMRYKLKDVVVKNDSLEANVYSGNETVGMIALGSVAKQAVTVWFGEMEVNGKQYNVYILEGMRKFKQDEIRESMKEYCKNHPQECVQLTKGIATQYCSPERAQTESCREKIVDYCKDHPTDQRCVALKRAFCALHTEDMRCREEMKDYCKERPNAEECRGFCAIHPLACGKRSLEIEEKIRRRTREFFLRGLQMARERIEEMKKRGEVSLPPTPPRHQPRP